jgi:hypothetical protein
MRPPTTQTIPNRARQQRDRPTPTREFHGWGGLSFNTKR